MVSFEEIEELVRQLDNRIANDDHYLTTRYENDTISVHFNGVAIWDDEDWGYENEDDESPLYELTDIQLVEFFIVGQLNKVIDSMTSITSSYVFPQVGQEDLPLGETEEPPKEVWWAAVGYVLPYVVKGARLVDNRYVQGFDPQGREVKLSVYSSVSRDKAYANYTYFEYQLTAIRMSGIECREAIGVTIEQIREAGHDVATIVQDWSKRVYEGSNWHEHVAKVLSGGHT